jgi:hypothetical protein
MENPYYLLLLAVLALLVGWLSATSNMLRNEVFNMNAFNTLAAAKPNPEKARAGFSLARTQIAFWTVIVIGSYIYVLISGSIGHGLKIPDLDQVNLVLLGVAAGTTVAAKAIDNSQQNTATADKTSQQDIPSKGFLPDILSDENGISVHRLQNVLWTIIVGGIYISYVNSKGVLPDKDIIKDTMLGLMGISSAAYLGLKTTENSTPVKQPATPGQQAPPAGQQAPPADKQAPPVAQQAPPADQQTPPVAQQVPPAAQQVPPAAQQAPPANQQEPPAND